MDVGRTIRQRSARPVVRIPSSTAPLPSIRSWMSLTPAPGRQSRCQQEECRWSADSRSRALAAPGGCVPLRRLRRGPRFPWSRARREEGVDSPTRTLGQAQVPPRTSDAADRSIASLEDRRAVTGHCSYDQRRCGSRLRPDRPAVGPSGRAHPRRRPGGSVRTELTRVVGGAAYHLGIDAGAKNQRICLTGFENSGATSPGAPRQCAVNGVWCACRGHSGRPPPNQIPGVGIAGPGSGQPL